MSFRINADARSRLNAVFIIAVRLLPPTLFPFLPHILTSPSHDQIFIGQAIGTAGSSSIFLAHGPKGTGLLWLNLGALQIVLLLVRGPHVGGKRWVGWEGGARVLRRDNIIDAGMGGEKGLVDLEKGEKSVLPEGKSH